MLPDLEIGSPLRVTVDDGVRTPRSGIYLGVAADTLRLLQRRETIGVPVASVWRLEVSRSRDRRKGMVYGAGIGGLAAALSFSGLMLAADEPGYARDGTPGMFVIGAMVGSFVGFTLAPRRWEVVSVLQPNAPRL